VSYIAERDREHLDQLPVVIDHEDASHSGRNNTQSFQNMPCRNLVAPARKDDESVQTSLRALMEQEEERIRSENERLEQLRAAKARIDHERAEAAREEEERRRTEREAKIAAAALRIEALAKQQPVPVLIAPTPVAPPPKPSRFVPGVATGAIFGIIAAAACFYAVGAPRIARSTKQAVDSWAELERVRTRADDAKRTSDDTLEQLRKDTRELRAENQRLRDDVAAPKPCTCMPLNVTPHPARHAHCDAHDPLCGDL
jgi:TolA-binding protein